MSVNLIELIDFSDKDYNLREPMMRECDKTESGVAVRNLTSLQRTSIHLMSQSLFNCNGQLYNIEIW